MDKNYISQIKAILKAESISQSKLADRLGVTFAALNRWIRGHAQPRASKMEAIGKLYREIVGYPAVTPKESARLIRQAGAFRKKGMWDFVARRQPIQDDLLLEHTYNSTSIEGTTFTKNESKAVIFDKAVVPNKSLKEHLEVTNHAAVLREILEKKTQGPITEKLIKELHRGVMQGLRVDAGEYSKRFRAIQGSNIILTHPKDIPEEMNLLIRGWKRKTRKKTIKEIADFHVGFELIHPFGDGNGRVGRLIMALQCLEADYPPIVIENARKAEYYEVLEYAQRKSEGPFLAFLVDEMENTSKILKKYR